MKRRILLVPSCEEGNGTGHLKRMIEVFLDIRDIHDVSLYLPCSGISDSYLKLVKRYAPDENIFKGVFPDDLDWDFIVADKRSTAPRELEQWERNGLVVGVDEGGELRDRFHFLIDTLPSAYRRSPPNIFDVCLLNLPEKRFRKTSPPSGGNVSGLRVLITFGGEDPFHLTEEVLSFFVSRTILPFDNITVVEGPLFGDRTYPEGIRVLRNVGSLKDILYQYDIVFTSFGLSAYETVCAGAYAILLNPTEYHSRLSFKAGFSGIGTGKINRRKLMKLLKKTEKIKNPVLSCSGDGEKSLGAVVSELIPSPVKKCPVCGSFSRESVARFSDRTFFLCSSCGIIYQVHLDPPEDSYTEDYFFSGYEKQYGRTYLEDFMNLKRLAGERLRIMKKFVSGGSLLDVGCAYGPFMAEAALNGFHPAGVEVVREAAGYVEDKLGFEVACSTFEEAEITGSFDAVTMWYVIEHFTNAGKVLAKVNAILKPGGVFAFSTPNSSGITGKSGRFFRGSPQDHYTVWNPRSAENILASFGFKVKEIRITGHHPERFPGFFKGEKGFKRYIMSGISRMFGLGDTFEVYAEKVRSISSDE